MEFAGYVVRRVFWMVPSLFGITLVTFFMMDLAPSDRAELAVIDAMNPKAVSAHNLQLLREYWGLVDPETKQPYSVWQRYRHWLGRIGRCDLAGPGEDPERFYSRITRALPPTLLVNTLALLLALAIGIPVGARFGMSGGGWFDRATAGVLFVAFGLPEFLLASLLLLVFAGGWFEPLLPSYGLRSTDAAALPGWQQALDMLQHLVLPVCTLTVLPCMVVIRFLRDSVRRARRSDYVLAMRGWGMPDKAVRQCALRNGLSPLVTLLGAMLPALVGGSVVVERVYSIPGVGRLAFRAMQGQDYPMVMALTLLVSVVTLSSLLISDLLHRVIDPRVVLR